MSLTNGGRFCAVQEVSDYCISFLLASEATYASPLSVSFRFSLGSLQRIEKHVCQNWKFPFGRTLLDPHPSDSDSGSFLM